MFTVGHLQVGRTVFRCRFLIVCDGSQLVFGRNQHARSALRANRFLSTEKGFNVQFMPVGTQKLDAHLDTDEIRAKWQPPRIRCERVRGVTPVSICPEPRNFVYYTCAVRVGKLLVTAQRWLLLLAIPARVFGRPPPGPRDASRDSYASLASRNAVGKPRLWERGSGCERLPGELPKRRSVRPRIRIPARQIRIFGSRQDRYRSPRACD